MARIMIRKSALLEIVNKSLFNSSEHPRGAGGRFIQKLAANSGNNGNGESNTQRRIRLANEAQNISIEEPGIKELNVTKADFKTKGEDYIKNVINDYLARNNVVCDLIGKRVSEMNLHIFDGTLHSDIDQLRRSKILPFVIPIIEMYGVKGGVIDGHQEIIGKADYTDPKKGKITIGIVVALSDNESGDVTANVITTYPVINGMIKACPINDTDIHPIPVYRC